MIETSVTMDMKDVRCEDVPSRVEESDHDDPAPPADRSRTSNAPTCQSEQRDFQLAEPLYSSVPQSSTSGDSDSGRWLNGRARSLRPSVIVEMSRLAQERGAVNLAEGENLLPTQGLLAQATCSTS